MSKKPNDRFGAVAADTMVVQKFRNGRWQPLEFVGFGDITISPLAKCLHYGQAVFEGMKAHRLNDGSLAVFRLRDHLVRLNRSAERMCIPEIAVEPLERAIRRLVALCSEAVPAAPGSLYIRPLVFADEPGLTPSISQSYTLLILVLPVQSYFARGEGLRLVTSVDAARAAPGGTGAAKCAGNYAAAMKITAEAKAQGFDEVVWLDPRENDEIEEGGAMNLFFVRGKEIHTAPCSDTLLAGVTRDSVCKLASDLGFRVVERALRVSRDFHEGAPPITEAFATGTAAGVVSVTAIEHRGSLLFDATGAPGPVTAELAAALNAVKSGLNDPYRWLTPVSRPTQRATG